MTFGLNKSDRGMGPSEGPGDALGPGSYQLPGMTVPLPTYTGFASTTKRMELSKAGAADMPGAGAYDLTDIGSMANAPQSFAANAFRSKVRRFKNETDDNAPGAYPLPSTLKHGRPKMYPRASRHNGIDLLENVSPAPPSIPAKNQMTGYETDIKTGKLVLQDPVEPGFAGTKLNSVGPGDYEPRIDVRFRSNGVPNFKGSDRAQLDRVLSKSASAAPGPGYYNYRGSFDSFRDPSESDPADFVMHLNASRKKLSASFASATDRSSMLRDVLKPRAGLPGPAQYSLPSTMAEAEKGRPQHLQCFTSSGERFFEPSYKQSITAPGMYRVLTEFESKRLKILKRKKLVARSGWAYNVAFESTEPRRTEPPMTEGPPPGLYQPKNYDIAGNIAKENVRAGPFGSTSERFAAGQGGRAGGFGALTREQVLATDLEREMNEAHEQQSHAGQPHGQHYRPRQKVRLHRSAFGVGLDQSRFRDVHDDPGPAPGSYDTAPRWEAPGAVPMQASNVVSRKVPETMPGPGDYVLPSTLKYGKKNRKNVMISTGQRESMGKSKDGPGPGTYSVIPSLLRPSHNIMLSSS